MIATGSHQSVDYPKTQQNEEGKIKQLNFAFEDFKDTNWGYKKSFLYTRVSTTKCWYDITRKPPFILGSTLPLSYYLQQNTTFYLPLGVVKPTSEYL